MALKEKSKIELLKHDGSRSSSTITSSYNNLQIHGANLCKYFKKPIKIHEKNENVENETINNENFIYVVQEKKSPIYVNSQTQTDFRESETQTDPWNPNYVVHKVFSEPEVLSYQHLTYGNGLPATFLEIEHIIRCREVKKLEASLNQYEENEKFLKKKELIEKLVRNEWQYKISKHVQMQDAKIKYMESLLADELAKRSERNDKLLKNLWIRKNVEIKQHNAKLKQKLQKELKDLEQNNPLNRMFSKKYDLTVSSKQRNIKMKKGNEFDMKENTLDSFLSKFPGLASIEEGLKVKQNMSLENEISLPKFSKYTQMENIIDEAFKSILINKQTKLPPKVYHQEYKKKEIPKPPKEPIFEEKFERPEEAMDPVEIFQKTLRGRFHQKQIMDLVERQKESLVQLLFFESPEEQAISFDVSCETDFKEDLKQDDNS